MVPIDASGTARRDVARKKRDASQDHNNGDEGDRGIAQGRLEDAEVERLLADYRYKILRLQREEEEALGVGADEFASETGAADAEDAAISSVAVALPEERRRIKELLAKFPASA